jgi:hypothetical protein
VHRRFAEALFTASGFDLRGREFDHFYVAVITGASSIEVIGGALQIRIWNDGEPERVVRKT